MRKTVIICDRCGKEIEGEPLKVLYVFIQREKMAPLLNLWDTFTAQKDTPELCEKCVDEIMKFAKTSKIKGRPSGKKVDEGKIRALHDAGRDIKWIAGDMNLEEEEVAKVLGGTA